MKAAVGAVLSTLSVRLDRGAVKRVWVLPAKSTARAVIVYGLPEVSKVVSAGFEYDHGFTPVAVKKFGQATLNTEPALFQQMSLCGSRICSSTRWTPENLLLALAPPGSAEVPEMVARFRYTCPEDGWLRMPRGGEVS